MFSFHLGQMKIHNIIVEILHHLKDMEGRASENLTLRWRHGCSPTSFLAAHDLVFSNTYLNVIMHSEPTPAQENHFSLHAS